MSSNWFIINVTSGQESASCQVLERLGYDETFYPQKRVELSASVRKKLPPKQKKAPPRFVTRAWVPGYVFACADDIACHKINGPHGRLHMRVLSPGGVPYRVTDQAMARMQDVPKRVSELIAQVEAEERALWEAKRPKQGQPAKIMEGPFCGLSGLVIAMRRHEVCIDGPLGEVCVPEQMAERVA